jgi:MFS family permease
MFKKSKKKLLDAGFVFITLYIVTFFLLQVFQGVGKSVRYPFVTLYVDDAVDKRKTGFYMGILTGTGIFGPALAYLLGGLFSKIYVTLERTFISTFISNIYLILELKIYYAQVYNFKY